MSDDTPQPATPEPDPFEQLLMGFSEPEQPAASAPEPEPEAPAAPESAPEPAPEPAADALPPTEALEYGHGPAEPAPTAPTVVFPGAAAPPTVAAASAPAADPFPQPVSAQQPPSQSAPGWSLGDETAATALYPAAGATAATTVLPGGTGGPPTSRGGGPTGTGGPFGNRKVLMWVLAGVAGLLVIALAVLITVLAMNANGSSPSPTTSPTSTSTSTPRPTSTSTRTPTPTPTVAPAIRSFVADPMVVQCQNASAVASVKLAWSTVGATQVAVASAAGLVDAIDNPYQNNLAPEVEGFSIPFACGNASWAYTLTIAGADGEHRSSVVTVTRLPFPTPTPTTPPAPAAPSFSNAYFTDGLDYVICPNFDDDLTATKDVSWASAPEQNAVEVLIAYSDSAYPGSSGSFSSVASGLAPGGQYPVPVDCGSSGASTYFTVKIVAKNASGTVETFLNGNTAS